MPIKLVAPRKGFSPFYYGRGTYLGRFVNRSTGVDSASIARKVIREWERQIEGGRFEAGDEQTFVAAAAAYMKAGGERRPLKRLIELTPFRDTPLSLIGQAVVDAAAAELFPSSSPATRNREVYTPISAVLKHAGITFQLRRPKGARGRELAGWLWPEQADRLLGEAHAIDHEFGLMCLFLLLTGLRLSEGTAHFTCNNLRLSESYAFIPRTKNGTPRPVFLPAQLVAALANHPRGLERGAARVFRFLPSGRLYSLLDAAASRAGVALPERQAFHLFRHTYGTWMRRYGGADTRGLVATGAWKSEQSASRYAHTVVGEEAEKASMLPVIKCR